MKSDDIIPLRRDQIKAASRMLARAFMDDPIAILAYPNEKDRRTRLPYMYEFSLRYSFSSNEIYTTSERLEGIVVWRRRGVHHKESYWNCISSGAIWPAFRMGTGAGKRMLPFYDYIENKHREIIPDPHWYLIGIRGRPELSGPRLCQQIGQAYASQDKCGKIALLSRNRQRAKHQQKSAPWFPDHG